MVKREAGGSTKLELVVLEHDMRGCAELFNELTSVGLFTNMAVRAQRWEEQQLGEGTFLRRILIVLFVEGVRLPLRLSTVRRERCFSTVSGP